MTYRYADELLAFLQNAPTAFHAVEEAEARLNDYTHLEEVQPWHLERGGKYYVTRNRSSLIAFQMPENEFHSFQMVAAHTDSPTFKIKENAEVTVRGHYVQLDVERYGGAIFSTWMDRPLSVAGRVAVRTKDGLQTRLVNLKQPMCVIPNVAIHMNRDINNGAALKLNVDLFPLWGTEAAAGSFRRTVAEAAQCEERDLLATDLYLYNCTPGCIWGKEKEFISAGHLDDLECAWTALEGFLGAQPQEHVNVLCLFDNEEVGSTTKQGANSTFLEDTLRRIASAMGKDEAGYLSLLPGSMMLSADNAHALHPNHPEYADPANYPLMNHGVVIKYNASQRYTTDAVSAAVFGEICQRANVPTQYYANRSDMPGGGTLGNISTTHVSVNTVDIGLAQLAMHSAWETAGTMDIDHMVSVMKAFYSTEIRTCADGSYLF